VGGWVWGQTPLACAHACFGGVAAAVAAGPPPPHPLPGCNLNPEPLPGCTPTPSPSQASPPLPHPLPGCTPSASPSPRLHPLCLTLSQAAPPLPHPSQASRPPWPPHSDCPPCSPSMRGPLTRLPPMQPQRLPHRQRLCPLPPQPQHRQPAQPRSVLRKVRQYVLEHRGGHGIGDVLHASFLVVHPAIAACGSSVREEE
jgi:hypothetical protein